MADIAKRTATLGDQLAALSPPQRREVASQLRNLITRRFWV
jgi:hypothetical protein